jgi:murein DD-endopeptidase MepM/ murein hydrolase activator NlpD
MKKTFLNRFLAEKYTVIIMADLAGQMFRFTVPRNLLKGVLSVAMVCFLIFGYFAYNMLAINLNMGELNELRQRSLQQKREIQKFAVKIEDFQRQISRLEKFDKKLRVITSLETVPDSHDTFGVGGPNDGSTDSFAGQSGQYSVSILNKLNEDLNHLDNVASRQEISFHELDSFFKDQASLLTSTPSIWPARGWVTSGFGYRVSPFTGLRELHEGIDIATHLNADIIAPANGIVIESKREGGYGNVVEIDHGYGIVSRFSHNSTNLTGRGDKVKRGQVIARVGSTGRSTGPHLHYEILLNGIPVNPLQYILTE